MGWLDTIMFWRKKTPVIKTPVIEPVEGFDVDGCFTLPGARLDDMAAADRAQPDTDDDR